MNVHLLRLSGSPFEMGAIHGKAAKDANALGALRFFGEFLDHAARFPVGGNVHRKAREAFRKWLGMTLEQRWIEQIPDRYRQMAQGFSQTAGVPLRVLEQAYVMPDLFGYLLAQRHRPVALAALKAWGLGCSSFVVTPSESEGRAILHARNLDFPAGNLYAMQPAVIEYHPDDGQAYGTVTSMGIDGPGITGINEAGITLALHMNYSKRVSATGTPVVIVGHEIIRQATTLKEAVEIARMYQVGAGWSFVISSAEERNAIVLEQDAKDFQLRGLVDRRLICTNHFEASNLAEHEYWTSLGQESDSRARMKTMKKRLTMEMIRNLSPQTCISILASSEEGDSGRERAFVNTVAASHTLSSVIFDAENRTVFVAGGPCPASKNDYSAFALFPGPFAREGGLSAVKSKDLRKERARREYCLSADAYFPHFDLSRAERHLKNACEGDAEEELYPCMLGLVQMQQGKFKEAQVNLEIALNKSDLSGYRKTHHHLFLARVFDLLGDREKAKKNYREAENQPEWRRQAYLGQRRPWKSRLTERVILDFILGEGILS